MNVQRFKTWIPQSIGGSMLDMAVPASEFDRILAERDALQQRLNELGEQHQGEPAALPERMPDLSVVLEEHYDPFMKGQVLGWNACIDKISLLGPLYTHGDPAEVERLRQRMLACEEIAENNAKACAEALTKLAEAHALLNRWLDVPRQSGKHLSELAGDTELLLSASAEPSAPVEIDERADIRSRLLCADHCKECGHPDCNGQCYGDDMMGDS